MFCYKRYFNLQLDLLGLYLTFFKPLIIHNVKQIDAQKPFI